MQETQSLGPQDPLEEGMATHSLFLSAGVWQAKESDKTEAA